MTERTKNTQGLKLLRSDRPADEPISARERSIEHLADKLAKRVEGLEQQIEHLGQFLEKQGQDSVKIPKPEEIQKLTSLLEQKIHSFADELKVETPHEKALSQQFVVEQLRKLAQVINLDSFKHLLLSILYGASRAGEVDDFGMDRAFFEQVKPFFDFLYYNYWRVSVKGSNNLPETGRGLIVANHSGTLPLDGCMIRLASENDSPLHRDIRFLVEDFVYHFPFLGTFMYRTGGVRACPENATRLLEANHLVTVFPEGVKGIGKHYKNRYRLQRFGRGGFIRLALQTKSPIIPTAVIGAEEIYPMIHKSTFMAKVLGVPYIPVTPTFPLLGPLGLVPLPSKWTIIFGEPISFEQYFDADKDDRLLVNQLSEQVRLKIQEMVFDGLAKRRSIWFG